MDKENEETLSEVAQVDCLEPHSLFSLLGHNTVHPTIPYTLYPGECHLFTVYKCTILITSKLKANRRSIGHRQICMAGIRKGNRQMCFSVIMSCV